jgi:hypothetical protein
VSCNFFEWIRKTNRQTKKARGRDWDGLKKPSESLRAAAKIKTHCTQKQSPPGEPKAKTPAVPAPPADTSRTGRQHGQKTIP